MLNYLLPFFGNSVPPPPVVVVPPGDVTITLNPANPGNLGLTPGFWTTHVTTTGGLTQVKWTVGIPGAKTITFARTSNLTSVPNYNHGDVIDFTGYGQNFSLTKDSSGTNRFLATGSLGFTSFNIGLETKVSDIRFTIGGVGGTGTFSYTILNLTNGQGDIAATFNRPGDSLIVKSIDEAYGATTSGVTFGGAGTKSITIAPHDPGNLVTSPAVWTTRINSVGLDQVKWSVVDANWTGSGVTSPPPPPVGGSGLVRGRPQLIGNSIRSDIGTLLRGVTFALDGPGAKATNYSNTRSNWQKFRDLKFNLVRMPFTLSYANISLNTQLPFMDAMVAHASATGMYCMFMYDNGYGVQDWNETFAVWPTICDRYKNNTNVFFEQGNEWVWDINEWGTSGLNNIADLYTQMHAAAPNSLIGCMALTSVGAGENPVSGMNTIRNRVGAGNFGKAFISTHSYYAPDYDPSIFATIKNSYPCMMTETTFTGSYPDDPVDKIPPIDATGTAWVVLNPRFGDLTYTKPDRPRFYGDDEESLVARVIPAWHNDGFDWAQDVLTGGSPPPSPPPATNYTVVNLINNTIQISPTLTNAGDTLVVRSIDDTIQDRSGPVSFTPVSPPSPPGSPPPPPPPPPPGGGPSLSMNPLNPGDLGTPPKVWQTVVTAVGMTSFEWIVRNADNSNVTNWAVANVVNGTATLRPTFTAAGQVLIVSTPDNSVRQFSGAVSFSGTASPPPPPSPPPGTAGNFNLLLRGQSNAYMFAYAANGYGNLKDALQSTTGKSINMYGEDGKTIFSGTAFLDWPNDGEQTTLLNYISAITATERAKPFITLWMHNENDQENGSLTTAQWVSAVRADAAQVRQRLGQTAATTPYVFIPIRFPYGDRTPIVNGMNQLVADPTFNAVFTNAAVESDILMNGGPEPGNNSSHLSGNDTVLLASKLVNPVVQAYNKIGGVASPPSPPSPPSSPPPPPGSPSLTMNPLNPGNLGSAPPATWQTTVTAVGMTSFEWVVRYPDLTNVGNWKVANTTNGQVVLNPTFTATGQHLIISTPDNSIYQMSGQVAFGTGTSPPPPVSPPGSPPPPPSSSTVRGRPRIQGNTIVTDQGTRMRGATMAVSKAGTAAGDFAQDINNWKLLRDKKLNVVRVDAGTAQFGMTINEVIAGYDLLISHAAATNMYIIVMDSSQFDPAYNLAELQEFWSIAAPRWKDFTHVIFETTNEPAWDYGTNVIDDLISIQHLIQNAAPNTLILVLDTGFANSDPVALMNQYVSRGGNTPPAVVALHPYWSGGQSDFQRLINAYPTFMTEYIWQDSGEGSDTVRVEWAENTGMSWTTLHGRFGNRNLGSNTTDNMPSLDRMLSDLARDGYTWTKDAVGTGTSPPPPPVSPPTSPPPPPASPPPVAGSDYAFANDFVKNLTMGVNLERGCAWGSNTAYFQKLKNDGHITHLKIYVPTRPEWSQYVDNAGINVLGDTIQNAVAAGLKVFIGFTDVLPFSDLNSQTIRDYIDNAARIIAARNIDPRFLAVGPWGEMAEWTNNNTPYNGLRKFYQDKLRSIFPNHNIITAGASWSAWEAMVDPTMEVYADKRTIYEWHSYPYDAKNSQTYANIQSQIDTWKNAKGVVTYCGEIAGDGAPDSPIFGDRGVDPANMPAMITAVSRGCWRERPAIWTITDQGYYRLNNDGSGNHDLRPEIATAFREADAYIRARPGFGT